MKRLRQMNGKDAESYQRCRHHANKWVVTRPNLQASQGLIFLILKRKATTFMRSVKWWLIRAISLKRTIIYLRIFEDVHDDVLLFLLPARSNTTDFRSVQSFHCDVANVALDSPRRRCGKNSEGCTSLFDHIPCRCSQGSDNESWWGTAGHKTKSPVEWTNWLWMNYSGFMFFCWTRNCKPSFPHFPSQLAACSFWIWGYFYIHYQESHIVQWHLCPALRKWTPTVLAMGCHGLSLWDWWGRLLALVRVDSSVSWSLKEPPWHRQVPCVSCETTKEHKWQNSKTRWFFQIWTKLVFTRSQDPELIRPRLLVMLADNWSFQICVNLRCFGRWVVQLQWKVAKSPVSSDASVPRFPRRKLLELPWDSSVECQSHLPGSSTSHSMCKTCDQDSWWNLEAEVLKNEAALILLTRPPTAHIPGKCRVHLLFLRKKPQYLVHNSATGWVQQNCLDC